MSREKQQKTQLKLPQGIFYSAMNNIWFHCCLLLTLWFCLH